MFRYAALAVLPLLLAAAGPSVEYGGAQEQRFVEACQGEGLSRATCACASERLQASLGYEAFSEVAGEGPAAFRASPSLAPHSAAAYGFCAGLGEAPAMSRPQVAASVAPR